MSFSPRYLRGALASCLAGSWMLAGCGGGPVIREPVTFTGNIALQPDRGVVPAVDLLELDPSSSRLFAPHTSRSALEVFDSRSGRLQLAIPGLSGIKAVTFVPGTPLVFSSDSGDASVALLDAVTGEVLQRFSVGDSPDALEYDPVHDLVAVSLPSSRRILLIGRSKLAVLGSIRLEGTPELLAVDPATGKLFVAIHDRDEVAVMDLGTRALLATYRGCDLKSPTGIAYDPAEGRLFVASDGRVNIIDVLLERCLGTVDTTRGVDEISLASPLHHLYVPGGANGDLYIIDTHSLKPLGSVRVAPGAKGIAADGISGRVFVGVPRAGLVAEYHDP